MRFLSVRLSVCQSNACIVTKRKKNLSRFYIMRKIIQSSFLRRRMVGGGDPFHLKFWVNRPRWSEIADFEPIIARSALAVRPSEKVQLTLIGSPLRAFRWAQDGHRTLYLSPQGWLKNAKCPKFEQQDNVQANLESVQCRVFQICKVFDYQYCKSRSRDPFPTPLT